ncbi:toll/interleukin-1 receptor domain-containing protein [Pseudomonas oryzihabitans]|uniref:toll/interleukin-1 receptor domain-containing protein n=1 Tax=Pseudomonas oryzihabitans TaxID=47885 RepID=UPI0018D7FE3E|nr:toll/interleukin-1 receptor domain-containing protein [Pseudomonas oryzihabitans]
MGYKIFLSHNSKDKPIVEPVAMRLARIFGEDQVFYDSWSIRPGDGIIDRMNQGLEAPEYVFFFVSSNSLASQMVKLEWQNSLHAATYGKTKIIPVRVDGSQMPALLAQTLYIDMYSNGLEAAIAQIVSVTQGSASFTPQHQGFSNLTCSGSLDSEGSLTITIQASHFMEPSVSFVFLTENSADEISFNLPSAAAFFGGFNENAFTDGSGNKKNAILMRSMGGALTPGHPFRVKFQKIKEAPVAIVGVYHEVAENNWNPVPFK